MHICITHPYLTNSLSCKDENSPRHKECIVDVLPIGAQDGPSSWCRWSRGVRPELKKQTEAKYLLVAGCSFFICVGWVVQVGSAKRFVKYGRSVYRPEDHQSWAELCLRMKWPVVIDCFNGTGRVRLRPRPKSWGWRLIDRVEWKHAGEISQSYLHGLCIGPGRREECLVVEYYWILYVCV